jgi:hypothetical protein
VPFWAPFSDAAEITSTTPFQPSRRRLGASSQPGNPLPNTLHHNVSARLDEAQLSHHSGVLRQMARKSDIASSVINLPELMQASGGGAAKACPGPHAFAHAGIVAVASTTVGAGTRARGRQRAPDIRRTPASPPPSFGEHVDIALLPLPLVEASGVARVIRGERLALLLPNHSLESASADFAAEAAAATFERAAVFLFQWYR